MSLTSCFCCCSKSDETTSVKSWKAGEVNKTFEKEEGAVTTEAPKVTIEINQNTTAVAEIHISESKPTESEEVETNQNTTAAAETKIFENKSTEREEDGAAIPKIDLNLNIFENERFGDMAAIIYKSQMNLDKI
ncbi:uncharacterized protein [Musca autumnalis]|uniref:uncharacterized protein n=1 Tax=Musca autumnalis TaxID=221902 RepID=UPI003CF3D051